jgi:type I protein arginine methyltransferase
VTNPPGYQLSSYGDMIVDQGRMGPYVAALREAVKPGDVVVDLGAGSGIFSFLACQFGAAHVHAIEPDPSIETAREIAAANGLLDRISFHRRFSTDVTLPRPADVVIADLRGVLPLYQANIPTIADARTRLLAPGGRLIPTHDTIWASLVHSPEEYQRYQQPWVTNDFGVDMSAGHDKVVNTWRKVVIDDEERLLVDPQRWARLDYATVRDSSVDGTLQWSLPETGTAHGVLMWFDAALGGGHGFSNAPGPQQLIYGQAFFPFEAPIELQEADHVTVRLRADTVDGEYVWRWETEVRAGDGTAVPPSSRFRQSTFHGIDLSPSTLRRRRADFQPRLGSDGRIELAILTQMADGASLSAIARALIEGFPDTFESDRDALDRVAATSIRYSE